MDVDFWKVLVACTAANLLTIWFLYSVYRISKAQERQEESKFSLYSGAIIPLLLVLGGMLLMKPTDPGPLRLVDIRTMNIQELSRLDTQAMTDAQLEEASIRFTNLMQKEMSVSE